MPALKYSRQRESIKEFLMGRTDHPTADTIYDNVRLVYPNISLGTVYRNLSLLSDIGEIQKLPSFGGVDRFDGRTDPHCHFMCTSCGQVSDIDCDDTNDLIVHASKNFNGKITKCTARFYGICEECLQSEEKKEN